jgi:chorismate synthase
VEFVSGLYEGMTTGTALSFMIRNKDAHSGDYAELSRLYRPSHADYTYSQKYGVRDPRGGGRASARETVARVVGGAVAKQCLSGYGIEVMGYTSQIGEVRVSKSYTELDLSQTELTSVRCPDAEVASAMAARIMSAKASGDSVGGVVTCVVRGVPVGLGEPVFDKLQALLGHACLSIPSAKGFDYGDGFGAPLYSGSAHNDAFESRGGVIRTKSNYSGGIQGGISNGEDIYFRVSFKAVPTIFKEQWTVDVSGEGVQMRGKGRHDACVVPRAVVVVEAMASMVILDLLLVQKTYS